MVSRTSSTRLPCGSSTATPAPCSMSHAILLRRRVLLPTPLFRKTATCFRRGRGGKAAEAKLQKIAQLPVEIVGVDMEPGKLAARLKAGHNPPCADCFAATLAQGRKATLVTSDKDFQRVGTSLKILWAEIAGPLQRRSAPGPPWRGAPALPEAQARRLSLRTLIGRAKNRKIKRPLCAAGVERHRGVTHDQRTRPFLIRFCCFQRWIVCSTSL